MKCLIATIAAVGCLLAACVGAEAASTVQVTLREWQIDLSTSSYLDGPVTLDIQNSGEFPHTLLIEGPNSAIVAATGVIQPGSATKLTLDLEADDLRFTCRIVTSLADATVVDHFARGMVRTMSAAGSD